jgi:hypothetical protein
MWTSKEQLKDSIIAISEYIGADKSYKAMFTSVGYTMPEIVKSLVYDMFLCKFDQTTCPLNLYAYYSIVFEYAQELNQNGFVEYSKN